MNFLDWCAAVYVAVFITVIIIIILFLIAALFVKALAALGWVMVTFISGGIVLVAFTRWAFERCSNL